MPTRHRPASTYRLQFHAGFTFCDAATITSYLHDLGITHAYASPYFKARPGSTHGYDVIDHNQLNPELGTEADYEAWIGVLTRNGMSHVLDIVPNHAGVATNDNAWWNDVLENGESSKFANHFDIAWRGSLRPELHGKVLLPVLGASYGQVLEKGELKVAVQDGRPFVAYYDRRFPINAESVIGVLSTYAGTPGDARSFDSLDALLNAQHYRLCYWRVASDEINYRRFFDINDLAALSMERAEVFEDSHRLVFQLIKEGKIAGLRIDHPDGLYDPKQYLDRLQARYAKERGHPEYSADGAGARGGAERDTLDVPFPPLYVLVEKILAPDEPLPDNWACHGTSGYDFLNVVNGLFIDPAGEKPLTEAYEAFTGDRASYEDLVNRNKRLVLETSLASELQMLTAMLDRLAQTDRHSRDFTQNGLGQGLREVIACFPVYRTYISKDDGVSETDRAHVERAVNHAIERNPRVEPAVFHFIRDTLLQKSPEHFTQEDRDAQLRFAGRFQQLTAPVTAKGIEDTTFYQYNRLVSLNEVGGEPGRWGVSPAEAHAWFAERQRRWPYAMSTLSTHDTKRSEDVRARINVLSEWWAQFEIEARRWRAANAKHRQGNAPSPNEEWLLYQTLIGAYPCEPMYRYPAGEQERFVERIQAYMIKAMREAKVTTSWIAPNEEHEKGVSEFIAAILAEGSSFLEVFRPFQLQVALGGGINSLSQSLLKLAAPGVPDTYQGTELLDFSLVDPDNRRPVDYARRQEMLDELRREAAAAGEGLADFAHRLDIAGDGRAKLYITWRLLTLRRERPGLFTEGDYLPIESTGGTRPGIFAFARRRGDQSAIVAVPLPGSDDRIHVRLPSGLGVCTYRNVFTGEQMAIKGDALAVADLFRHFPVALLLSE